MMNNSNLMLLFFLVCLLVGYYYWLNRHKGKDNPNFRNYVFLAAIGAVLDYLTSLLLPIDIAKLSPILQRFMFGVFSYPLFWIFDYIIKEAGGKKKPVQAPIKRGFGYKLISFALTIPTIMVLLIIARFILPAHLWQFVEPIKSGLLMAWLLGLVRMELSKKYFINLSQEGKATSSKK